MALVLSLAWAWPAAGEVFASKQEALASAFPDADRIEHRSAALDDAEAERVQSAARAPLESRLVTLYTAWKDDQPVGYAFIDVHTVRTLPEAFLVVLTPEGRVRSVRMLAFYEPPEYLPSERWLAQFASGDADEIHGIAGSTLSSRAVRGGVRRSLALFELLVGRELATVAAGSGATAPPSGGR